MINYSEENAVKLSATKKDFYQIWNELLETASKISERWDPTSTNESDPGIVLLKVLTAVADKLNYNIDVNALEAFMPSAAQEESMRKLTEMLGYNMKYYRSATTDALITYNLADTKPIDETTGQVTIDKFTNLKDIDDTVNYVTLYTVYLNQDMTSVIVPCMEGELVECETEDDNIVSLLQLDDNNRYYLPEVQIAENGIFVTNINNSIESDEWVKVDNLNTQKVGYKCYKFGFDSKVNLPYIQFPADINNIIEDGLKIKYIRTNGINGNITAKTLYKMEKPASWQVAADGETSDSESANAAYFNVDNYSVSNTAAAQNGGNIESITDAYNSFKKTIGTFDTLVTCRDYMNKIYNLTISDTSTTALVSNIIVSDIRDDINKANTLCTFGPYGIEYKNVAKKIDTESAEAIDSVTWDSQYVPNANETDESSINYQYSAAKNLNQLFRVYEVNPSDPSDKSKTIDYYRAVFDGNFYKYEAVNTDEITHFDLVFYPFKNIYGLNTKAEYIKSFQYDDSNILEIKEGVEENKTLSHNIITPNKDDLACIKNYLNLKASITTTRKVNYVEQKAILANVYSKLYENFNMRKVDFGEEIPYDDILKVMETADPRIKNVSLEDPILETKFCSVEGGEFAYSKDDGSTEADNLEKVGNYYFNRMALNNVLAGRIPLFNYDENFRNEYNESKYPSWIEGAREEQYDLLYPATIDAAKTTGLSKIVSKFAIRSNAKNIKLRPNEVVQFRLPNLRTTKTYPAYVNYFIKLNGENTTPAIPATMKTLKDFLASSTNNQLAPNEIFWDVAVNATIPETTIRYFSPLHTTIQDQNSFEAALALRYALFYFDDAAHHIGEGEPTNAYIRTDTWIAELHNDYYYIPLDRSNAFTWDRWLKTITIVYINGVADNLHDSDDSSDEEDIAITLNGLYSVIGTSADYNWGELVDRNHTKFKHLDIYVAQTKPFEAYYVQETHNKTQAPDAVHPAEDCYTVDGLGQNANPTSIEANEERVLNSGEYLLINYTSSTSTESTNKTIINEYYGAGTIIKPSFDLVDSEEYRQLHKYSKIDNYGPFIPDDGSELINPAGMFTLGTSEQIEIREFIVVDLDKDYTNIYWTRNDEVAQANGRILFNFESEPVYKKNIDGHVAGDPVVITTENAFNSDTMEYTAYTLKDGEYFYYTNKDKLDIAYYGAGTKIKKTIYTPQIFKSRFDNEISADEVATKGLSSAIPWRPYTLGKAGNNERKLTLIEYQYITLAADSTLVSFEAGKDIDNEWTSCTGAHYKLDADSGEQTLPAVNLGEGITWEVRSKLELNVGPNLIQQLYANVDSDLNDITVDSLSLYDNLLHKTTPLKVIQPHNGITLSLKANKLIQSTTDTTLVDTVEIDGDETEVTSYDCQVKVFELVDLRDVNNNAINLNNFGEGTYTKLNFSDDDLSQSSKPYASFRAIIPGERFGLLMIYYNKLGATSAHNAGIRLINPYENANAGRQPQAPVICNNIVDGNEAWWQDRLDGGCVDEHMSFWATEGINYSGISAAEFNTLKTTETLYIREVDSSWSDSDSDSDNNEYYLHSYDYTSAGNFVVYKYTRVAPDAQYDQSKYYCQLLDEGVDGTGKLYRLRPGINVVKIKDNSTIQIFPDMGNKDIVIISPFDIVYTDGETSKSINPKLCYRAIDTKQDETRYTISEQIMKDILVLDPDLQFYYNALMNNETALDLNPNDPDDTLENPLNWYNYNNINNKFVVSEINADYLSTGVVIARNSKL